MGQRVRARRGWIAIVATVVVALAACGPPFPNSPPRSDAPLIDAQPTSTTVVVPPTVLPAAQPLVCPGSSGATAPGETVPMVVDDPLEGSELFAATIEAVTDASSATVAEPEALSAHGEPTVMITSVVDGTPVVDTVAVSESLGAAADASLDGDVVAVEAPSTVTILDDAAATSESLSTNDPLRGDLWAFDALDIERMWQCGTGHGVTVAVVDSGVLGSHPDLVARVTPGWTKLTSNPGTVGGADVDPNGHGTHVAGTIGAVAGNGLGVAGVAPDVTIVPVRVLGATGTGTNANVAAGIIWAVDHGVDVINLSLGGVTPSEAVLNALRYAELNGVTVVAAAGNKGADNSPAFYPAAFDESIAVAAITPSLVVADYSNRGAYVDVAAPGSNILSTYNTGTYAWDSGTSMAAPHVSGLAALLLSAEPDLSADELRARLTATADDAGEPGFDLAYGWGIINPIRALTGAS